MKGRSSKVLLFWGLIVVPDTYNRRKEQQDDGIRERGKACARGSSPIYGILDPLLLR